MGRDYVCENLPKKFLLLISPRSCIAKHLIFSIIQRIFSCKYVKRAYYRIFILQYALFKLWTRSAVNCILQGLAGFKYRGLGGGNGN